MEQKNNIKDATLKQLYAARGEYRDEKAPSLPFTLGEIETEIDEREYEEKNQIRKKADDYEKSVGVRPSHVGNLYGKVSLSFTVKNIADAAKIKEAFKPSLIPFAIRTAGKTEVNASHYAFEVSKWAFNGKIETKVHFETNKEIVAIKLPFDEYRNFNFSVATFQYEGDELEIRRLRHQSTDYQVPYLSGFDVMRFYGGSTKTYIKPENATPELLAEFERRIFSGEI